QVPVTGNVPLTGIQHHFFTSDLKEKGHYNQSVMLDFPGGISVDEVRILFTVLQSHHDALRMGYGASGMGVAQYNHGPELDVAVPYMDLSHMKRPQRRLLSLCNELQSGIDLESPPLFKLGLFDLNSGSRLLIAIHHLVVDGISWRILFEDIGTLYDQLKEGVALKLPLKTDSFQLWSERLQSYPESDMYRKASAYWSVALSEDYMEIPRTHPKGSNKVSDVSTLGFRLSKSLTKQLLGEVHSAFNTQINDLLLAGFLLSVNKHYGDGGVRIDLEGHGREEIIEGLDVGRTVGWFTSIYPVVLAQSNEGLSTLIKSVKESLRLVPNNGVDYLIGKYLADDVAMDSEESSRISFNYLGQFDSDTKGKAFSIASEPTGDTVSLSEDRDYDWDISGMVSSGRLWMGLSYSTSQYDKEEMEVLMATYEKSLVDLINHCKDYGKQELTPSDLTYKDLSIVELEELQGRYEVEDIYSLSPMQEGMLFHSLLDGEADHYFNQMNYRLTGSLDIELIKNSFQGLIDRYGTLRTIFLHEGYERSLQLVLKEREGFFVYEDVKEEVLEFGRASTVGKYNRLDKNRKFDLSEDVLMRLHVYLTGDGEYEFIWSFHHILMDGWCMSILVNEFNAFYRGLLEGKVVELPEVRPYSRYIEWLEARDRSVSKDYWRDYLSGYEGLTSIPRDGYGPATFELATQQLLLDGERTGCLRKVSQKYGVTINTILQSAWGILLGKYNNTGDVVFGAVVSGRPATLEGVETMIGLFINTVPVRIVYDEGDTVADLLADVQGKALEGEPYHYDPLMEIQSSSGLGKALLDHILVFENYPIAKEIAGKRKGNDDYGVSDIRAFEQTNYDLSVVIEPGDEVSISFNYNASRFSTGTMERVSRHLSMIIDQMGEVVEIPIKDISILSDVERDELLHAYNDTAVAYP
ncbi:condensation domain-containing protein, partial [Maribacter sp. 2307UL18-2]|uniref:condensation domain-containing protein n=1 Tax=Maribacter sp. 2307UL18-2 TaxID=3386274 RepID=UPI0039BD4280